MIVLDTSVLSLAFRRRKTGEGDPAQAVLLRQMVADDWPLAVPGIVLQELLSGVRSDAEFRKLERCLRGFPRLLAGEAHHLHAARIVNACRRRGIVCSAVDALIAALTIDSGGELFSNDTDFGPMASFCGLKLFSPPERV